MKDSEPRQREAIRACAAHFNLLLGEGDTMQDGWFADPSVKGTDEVTSRPGFSLLLEFCHRTGVRDIVFEDATRFARDLITQEVAYNSLSKLGFNLYSASSPQVFLEGGETAKLVRCVLGAIHEFERSGVVKRLAASRLRAAEGKFRIGVKRTIVNTPKPVGRDNYFERWPELEHILLNFLEHPGLSRDHIMRVQSLSFSAGIMLDSGKKITTRVVRMAFARLQQMHA